MKSTFFALVTLVPSLLLAQPDTLWIPTQGQLIPHAVTYDPIRSDAVAHRIGRFAQDTTHIAVRMDYKRGTASGVFRAFYPDGRPLIFAVYGWGSLHGDWTEYDETGSVSVKGQYRQGLRDGTWSFRKEGIIGRYKKGLKHGKWKYYEDGLPSHTEKYRKDELKRTRTFGTN